MEGAAGSGVTPVEGKGGSVAGASVNSASLVSAAVAAVDSACEMLGLDPLQVANEGKLVAFVAPECAEEALAALKESDTGEDAAVIGEVIQGPKGRMTLHTEVGGTRIVPLLSGDLLPRIC